MNQDKDGAVQELVQWHFQVDPKTSEIYRFVADNEDETDVPIKLLEVNDMTLETGRVDAFGFGPAVDFPYSSVVAQVTTRELDRIRKREMLLPDGWSLDSAQVFQNENNGHAQSR